MALRNFPRTWTIANMLVLQGRYRVHSRLGEPTALLVFRGRTLLIVKQELFQV